MESGRDKGVFILLLPCSISGWTDSFFAFFLYILLRTGRFEVPCQNTKWGRWPRIWLRFSPGSKPRRDRYLYVWIRFVGRCIYISELERDGRGKSKRIHVANIEICFLPCSWWCELSVWCIPISCLIRRSGGYRFEAEVLSSHTVRSAPELWCWKTEWWNQRFQTHIGRQKHPPEALYWGDTCEEVCWHVLPTSSAHIIDLTDSMHLYKRPEFRVRSTNYLICPPFNKWSYGIRNLTL